MKLFVVLLGGRAPRCNTELHDVVFVTGDKIEDTYDQLTDLWFGTLKGLHIDSWIELGAVDSYEVSLKEQITYQPKSADQKLFFINLGAYQPGVFTEFHASTLLVADNVQSVKRRAKQQLLSGYKAVHTDDLLDVDDCIEVSRVNGLHVHLQPTELSEKLEPNNGYYPIPKTVIAEYLRKNPQRKN